MVSPPRQSPRSMPTQSLTRLEDAVAALLAHTRNDIRLAAPLSIRLSTASLPTFHRPPPSRILTPRKWRASWE